MNWLCERNVKVEEEHVRWSVLRAYAALHYAADNSHSLLL